MTSQALTNRGRKKYTEFDSAITGVRMALEELDKFTKGLAQKTDKSFEGWRVPTRKEIRASVSRTSADLDTLRREATRYKAKLIANGWRV